MTKFKDVLKMLAFLEVLGTFMFLCVAVPLAAFSPDFTIGKTLLVTLAGDVLILLIVFFAVYIVKPMADWWFNINE